MREQKQLSKRQLAMVEDLFAGGLDEQQVLDKYKVSRRLFNRWLAEPAFAEHLRRYIDAVHLRSAMLVARKASEAADALVGLTKSSQGETARKACLDIIQMNAPSRSDDDSATPDNELANHPSLTDETAGKILAALAESTAAEKGASQKFGA